MIRALREILLGIETRLQTEIRAKDQEIARLANQSQYEPSHRASSSTTVDNDQSSLHGKDSSNQFQSIPGDLSSRLSSIEMDAMVEIDAPEGQTSVSRSLTLSDGAGATEDSFRRNLSQLEEVRTTSPAR